MAYLMSVSFINCNPLSVMISFGVLNLHECFHRSDAADVAVTSVVCNNSMYLLKVSIMTMIWEKPMSVGNGPIVSIAIRVIGDTVDSTNQHLAKILVSFFRIVDFNRFGVF